MKSPKITSSICSLHFLSDLCHTCFFSNHWGCTICSQNDTAGPVHSNPVQRADECGENISCCCGISHWHQLYELLSDGQNVINSADEYGRLRNISNVRTFINCNWKCNKRLYFFSSDCPNRRKIRTPVCNYISCQADICKSLALFRAHNLRSLQHACFHKFTLTKWFWSHCNFISNKVTSFHCSITDLMVQLLLEALACREMHGEVLGEDLVSPTTVRAGEVRRDLLCWSGQWEMKWPGSAQ